MPAARVHTLPSDLLPGGQGEEIASSAYDRLTRQLHHDKRWQKEVSLDKRVGFYRLRGELGTGYFSHVKMAVHQLTSERVAIKILDKTKLDQKTRRMLMSEVANMEKIQHPNIIRLYEVVETYSKLHLVMEFAAGGELFHRISNKGRLPEDPAKIIFIQIVSAVHYLHGRGIIHRDIKAENVFYAGPSVVKLGDFGFSTQLTTGAAQQLDTFCGSPPYAAPELFRDESYHGGPVDVWALGVLLAFIVTGHLPFRASTVASLKRHILDCNFSLPSHLSDECQGLIAAILRQTPSDRLPLEQVLSSAWLQDIPPPAVPNEDDDWVTLPTRLPASNGGESSPTMPAMAETEVQAREKLKSLGIGPELLQDNIDKGVRSPVIGAYRITVHRLQKRAAMSPSKTPSSTVLYSDNFHHAESDGAMNGVCIGGMSPGSDNQQSAPKSSRGFFRKSKSAAVKHSANNGASGQKTTRSRTCVIL